MSKYFFLVFVLISSVVFSQNKGFKINTNNNSGFGNGQIPQSTDTTSTTDSKVKAPIDLYKIITIDRDTTYIDTSLTIRKEYIFNYLRRDNFGLLPFANEGQTYNTVNYNLKKISAFPEFGFLAKHHNYLDKNQIKYFSVPTPLTELYFKTVMGQGQSLDAFLAINTNERLNFSVAYKGLRSVGNYVNQLSSTGNFRFTTNYNSKSDRYILKTHLVVQDIFNGENGGIVSNANFESNNNDYRDRARLQVYLRDATSKLKGNRFFIDQMYRLNPKILSNNISIAHQFTYDDKYFDFQQPTVLSTINTTTSTIDVLYFGKSYINAAINDKTNFNQYYNKLSAIFENESLGKINFFVEDFFYKYYYNSVLVLNNKVIPSAISDRINTVGANYAHQIGGFNSNFSYSNSVFKQSLSDLNAVVSYQINDKNAISFAYQKTNKLPNHNYNLYQSSYVGYNWNNDFKNEKINSITIIADSQWVTAQLNYQSIDDKLYFSQNNDPLQPNSLLVTPKQSNNTINYLSLQFSKEIKYWRLALDNTLLLQQTEQNITILNVPKIVTRNSLYYSDTVFKKAMFLQTGFVFNYFSSYYADNYNPLIGEFYIQNQKKIGNFPMIDFFVNAKIRQTRVYLKAEHFNSLFTKNNFYAAPNYPYRDFVVRFGLVWNFFQ